MEFIFKLVLAGAVLISSGIHGITTANPVASINRELQTIPPEHVYLQDFTTDSSNWSFADFGAGLTPDTSSRNGLCLTVPVPGGEFFAQWFTSSAGVPNFDFIDLVDDSIYQIKTSVTTDASIGEGNLFDVLINNEVNAYGGEDFFWDKQGVPTTRRTTRASISMSSGPPRPR
jgi:hypothetical protein